MNRKPSLEVQRRDARGRVVQSLISAADLAGRNDWHRFNRAIADARRAINRYRQSTAGDTAALSDVESLTMAVDNVIALASYDGTVPDIDVELGDADTDTNAVVYLGAGVNLNALTNSATEAIAATAKSLPVENPLR